MSAPRKQYPASGIISQGGKEPTNPPPAPRSQATPPAPRPRGSYLTAPVPWRALLPATRADLFGRPYTKESSSRWSLDCGCVCSTPDMVSVALCAYHDGFMTSEAIAGTEIDRLTVALAEISAQRDATIVLIPPSPSNPTGYSATQEGPSMSEPTNPGTPSASEVLDYWDACEDKSRFHHATCWQDHPICALRRVFGELNSRIEALTAATGIYPDGEPDAPTLSKFWVSRTEPLVDMGGNALHVEAETTTAFLSELLDNLRADPRCSNPAVLANPVTGELVVSSVVVAVDQFEAKGIANDLFSHAIEISGGVDMPDRMEFVWAVHLLAEPDNTGGFP